MSSNRPGALLAVALLLSGCATVQDSTLDELNSWTGRHYTEALHQLGRPAYIFADRSAALVFAYGAVAQPSGGYFEILEDSLVVYDSLIVAATDYRSVPMRVSRDYDLLYVDGEGVIYSYQSNYSSRNERRVFESNAVIAAVGLTAALLILVALSSNPTY